MHRIFAIFALTFAAALHASVPQNSIESFIAAEMPVSGAPGMAYGVATRGEISGGENGVLRINEPAPVGQETPFMIGSVSKSFTALAVMQLVEAGDAELDAPISQYLDVFANKPGRDVTIRQLLSHTSGYSMLQGNSSQTDFTMDAAALERRTQLVAAFTLASAPGTKWEYSNANYQVLGRLIEVVSGQNYASYIEANVLAAAGMSDSFVHGGAGNRRIAIGHRPWFGSKFANSENLTGLGSAPQGGIMASARDMARYLAMMMNGQDDVLSAAGKAQMMQPASEVSSFYGFGWFLDTDKGVVYHSGSNPGYEALATMVPEEERAVAVLVNTGSGTGFGETIKLRNGISARAIGTDYNGEAYPWQQQATFLMIALTPILFVISMVWAWRKRAIIRAKSGAFGLFSLWFPMIMTLAMAWIIFGIVPMLFGAPFETIRLFQPDIGFAMAASVVTGIAWAVWRLALAYWPSTDRFSHKPPV